MSIQVKTKDSVYEVYLGENILQSFCERQADALSGYDQLVLITDEHVWSLHEEYVRTNLTLPIKIFIVPNGEACKTFESYFQVQSFLLEENCSRNSALLALGGGAVGDLTGFVAATFMRGIPFYQIPTTILAHDSAVGGKTAINHPNGKNMIGAFYQPMEVLYDFHFLKTLPEVEVRSGLAEVIKHALISDTNWMDEFLALPNLKAIDNKELLIWLEKGIRVKARIVEIDEKEQSYRKFLNFGHTYGHAIEATVGYGKITHGEAVMIGIIPALMLSELHGKIDMGYSKAVYDLANRLGYNFEHVLQCPFESLAKFMQKDKKTMNGELHFALLQEIGNPFVKIISMDEVKQCDEQLRQWVKEANK
ncbi:3-dehydroquinate synthase [Psychrobacillus sp. INOP01]|uniref:3-dehydroquinate synthase n=1 Tax=Psychrobacillus sp. INOP01 TaxID=2829187 RepID=UPI001BAC1D64|nr:3-dehydroquinate synthase [Psychrobacillus sp. INOP01]QUG41417.1 3-dehydroquinate synthase [Psychrobacillus sp. INOP01]